MLREEWMLRVFQSHFLIYKLEIMQTYRSLCLILCACSLLIYSTNTLLYKTANTYFTVAWLAIEFKQRRVQYREIDFWFILCIDRERVSLFLKHKTIFRNKEADYHRDIAQPGFLCFCFTFDLLGQISPVILFWWQETHIPYILVYKATSLKVRPMNFLWKTWFFFFYIVCV